MNLQRTINRFSHDASCWLKRSSPTILCVVAAIGVVGTAVAAAMATPKALEKVEDIEDEDGPLTTPEKVLVMAPNYIPAAAIGVGTIVCIFGANALNRKQQALILSAYYMLDSTYKEYKAKVVEMLGKDGAREIQNEIIKDHFKEFRDNNDYVKEIPLFYEPFTKQFFNREMEEFIGAKYELNRRFQIDGYVSLETWLDLLHLDAKKYPISEISGWDIDTLASDWDIAWIDIDLYTGKTDDGLEYHAIEYVQDPTTDEDLYSGLLEKMYPECMPAIGPRENSNAHYGRR